MRKLQVIRCVLLEERKRLKLQYLFNLGLLIALVSIPSQSVFGQTTAYVVTDLSKDDAAEVPVRLNNKGDIAGRAAKPTKGGIRATIWNYSDLKKKELGALSEGDYSSAFAINDTGQVAGVSNTAKALVPFLWTPASGFRPLPLLYGDKCGQAVGINKYGHVVGYSSGRNGAKAFVWSGTQGTRVLAGLPGGDHSRACDVNDLDQVVGTSDSTAGERAVLWSNTGNVLDLGTLPGDWASEATGINNMGEVIGCSKGPRGMHAFIWTPAGGMQQLGVLPGGTSSRALAINDLGEVVGSSTSTVGDHAFLWTRQRGMTDLNNADSANLGVVLIEAHSINAKGKIIAMGTVVNAAHVNSDHSSSGNQVCAPAPPSSFLLTPVAAK